MKKTLVLCFIHGFRGGNQTFGEGYAFTEHLKELVQKAAPKVNVEILVYPQYETRGDLGQCVMRFRNWLEEKVIDMEVDAGTASPTVDPSVRVVLVGHSMGGIVAVETVLGIASEKPIYSEDGIEKSEINFNRLMFPYIQGVLAFDTPYLGISPGVVAHGAEGHYQAASAAITQLGGLWGANKAASGASNKSTALTAPNQQAAGGGNAWSKWGKVAVAAGAVGAVAAGGAAAWMKRDQITEGWSWVSSHLEFVGCLARKEELKKRVECMVQLSRELDLGYANVYTRLGKAAAPKQVSMVGTVLGRERTFCNLPSNMDAGEWKGNVNDEAADETAAHTAMFEKDNNSGFEALSKDAAGLIAKWLRNDWYESSTEEEKVESDTKDTQATEAAS